MTATTDLARRQDARHRISRRPGPARPSGPPSPERLIRLVATVFLEVEAGVRPTEHIRPLLSEAAWDRVRGVALHARNERDRARSRRQPAPPVGRVLALRAYEVDATRWEASVTVRRGERAGALAIRIERHLGLWRCTEVHPPERGGTALRTRSLDREAPRRDAFDEAQDEAKDEAKDEARHEAKESFDGAAAEATAE